MGVSIVKMNYNISFQERATLATIQFSKQLPTNLEQAKKQVLWLKKTAKQTARKRKVKAFCNPKRSLVQ